MADNVSSWETLLRQPDDQDRWMLMGGGKTQHTVTGHTTSISKPQ